MKFVLMILGLSMCIQTQAKTFLNPPEIIPFGSEHYQSLETRKFQGISSIAVTDMGTVWAVWYAGPTPGEDKNNYVVVSRSDDDGNSWQEQFEIDPDGPGDIRAFDPEVWVDPQGRLWVFWAQHPASDRLNPHSGVWALVTDDADSIKVNWSKPRRITEGIMMCKPTVLSDGKWLLPPSTWRGTDYSARAVVSPDSGLSFDVVGACDIQPKDQRDFDEHIFVEKQDGTIWMLVRTKYGIGESFSYDKGLTWSELKQSTIKHPAARFFIRRLSSGNLLLVKHGKIDEKIGRSHLMAFISEDDGKSWRGGLLIDERKGVSYPDGQQTPDGTIYITYDYSRKDEKEIYMATFTEDDAAAGKDVSDKVRLNVLISEGAPDALADNKDGQPFEFEPAGKFVSEKGEVKLFKEGEKLFSDRSYTANKIPAQLDGMILLQVDIDGTKSVQCISDGMLYFLTPQPLRNDDSQSDELEKLGFKKVAMPEFPLFNPPKTSNYCTLYQKKCNKGEIITFGKWAVPLFAD
ncbi:MAG: sialidase family protein [Sedimentisphaeraceae bacterium JB056]